ncbi:COR domain-containing protein [Flavobacterium sp. MC2016-06]|uniref:COR domain-containing protein n=1 Tax=Flavobacterium sp. MC2016-06 TaxID=2676308 RepID=UPI0012BAC4B6|nr:COR domain-containing protein [Flavobacterium sp. MC2016-06]MBU3859084.1 GTP-binding protein [Flavobacterium sp. MC2016-06]
MKYTKGEQLAIIRIANARNERSRYLDLSGLNLMRIPCDISDLIYILDIDLSFNSFRNFPKEIGLLENLQYLDFSHNNLVEIYFEYGRNYCLKELKISHNLLNFVPEELDYLPHSTTIIFNENPFLENLPLELIENEDLSYIKYYQDSLRTADNKTRLFETKILLVGRGDVGKTTILKKLLDENFIVEIGKETSTHGIDITTYKENVIYPALNPHYNRLEDAENLYIRIEDDIEDEEDGVVTEAFFNVRFIPFEKYFYGVDIPLEIRISDQPNIDFDSNVYFEKEIKVNVWDFGGQEMLYATHQFFLTKRSVYIFVWDSRADNDEDNFEYWLSIINRLGGESPIIVVMNKSDIRIKSIDENFFRNKYKNIVTFINISCSNNNGFDDLRSVLNQVISEQKHIGSELPKSWNSIRENLKNCEKNYLTFAEFKEFLNITDSDEINHVSGFLRDLGDIIYFGQDYGLKDIIVLNPNWLTKAIYELIHSLEIQKSKGAFKLEQLANFLDLKHYPEEKHFQIVALMTKFEICFQILGSNNDYIIPVLLSPILPNTVKISNFEVPETLKFIVRYTFLPAGIIERIICRLNFYLEGENYWKYGAIFTTEVSRGIVQLDRFKKIITISVIGSLQAYLFSIIKNAIDIIHDNLKLIDGDFEEVYVCNCNDCALSETPTLFERKILFKYLERDKEFIECQKSIENININNILSGFKSNKSENSLLRKFIDAASKLQSRKIMLAGFNENKVNIYYQDLLNPLLKLRGNSAKEQSLLGTSSTLKGFGQIDISVEDVDGIPKTIFEGFFLSNVDTTIIKKHLDKTISNYDANGLIEKYLGIYCKSVNFNVLVEGYSLYIKSFVNTYVNDIEILGTSDISQFYVQGSEIKVFRTDCKRSNQKLHLYHLLINIYQP